jgi:hypothetical protein
MDDKLPKSEPPDWLVTVAEARRKGTPPLGVTWYAYPNDVIGGWCVMPVDAPPGEANVQEVADFVTEEAARHVADLHNYWLLGLIGKPEEVPPVRQKIPLPQRTERKRRL